MRNLRFIRNRGKIDPNNKHTQLLSDLNNGKMKTKIPQPLHKSGWKHI